MHIFDIISILILLAGIFLFVNTYFLKLPSSIGLMILALILSLTVMLIGYFFPDYHLAQKIKQFNFTEVMSRFVLSAMLFAGALNINFRKYKDQLAPILFLSFFGIIISTAVIGVSLYLITSSLSIPIDFTLCLVFGSLISGTDAVAISKILKKYRVSSQLESKLSGESWINSSIAIVLASSLYQLHLSQLDMTELVAWDSVSFLMRDIAGGFIVGALFGWVGLQTLKWIDNDIVEAEILITLALVMGGSYLADLLSVSPMLVAVLTGIIMTNFGQTEGEEENAVGAYIFKFWKLMLETLAAMLFVLIGFEMLVITPKIEYIAIGFFMVAIVLLARWISVFIPIRLMSQWKSFGHSTTMVLTWGAIRGGLPVAFILSFLPGAGKDILLTITYVVVVCSVLYQGFTLDQMMQYYRAESLKERYQKTARLEALIPEQKQSA